MISTTSATSFFFVLINKTASATTFSLTTSASATNISFILTTTSATTFSLNTSASATTFSQCWYGTMFKENFNVLDMSWTLSWTCPVQVSRPNIPLYSVIIKDSN